MNLDSLGNSVKENRAQKAELVKERLFFDAEQNKVDLLSSLSSHLDDTIVSAVFGYSERFFY